MFIDNFRRLCASRGVPETRVTKEIGIGGGTYMNWKNGSGISANAHIAGRIVFI